jgi:sugar O-acyltransferase (sialic acid O-acetyltransferase NeuD family)
MLIGGAKGHAKEVLQIIVKNNINENICFFDDISMDTTSKMFKKYPIIRTLEGAKKYFETNPDFLLAIGNPILRKKLSMKLIDIGGRLTSIIACTAIIGDYEIELGAGLNIMHGALVNNSVKIGEGCLINAFVSIHHDSILEKYCEIGPRATLLGNCYIGAFTFIGACATILPNVQIGKNVQVAAGAMVCKNVPDNCMVAGVPAIIKKELKPINFG